MGELKITHRSDTTSPRVPGFHVIPHSLIQGLSVATGSHERYLFLLPHSTSGIVNQVLERKYRTGILIPRLTSWKSNIMGGRDVQCSGLTG